MKDTLSKLGIIPVVKIDDAKNAKPLAKALIDGGLPVAEVTFRTSAAPDAIKTISDAFPEMLVGAGTVLSVEQAQKAVNCGAKFIVSPGFNAKVVKWCIDNNIPVFPGCTTPTEVEAALEMGLDTVKFFPAGESGGLPKIKALCAPYTTVKFIPTGGVDLKNLNEYLSFPRIAACGGSFMVKADYINNGEWDKITEITKSAVQLMLGFELAHIGINTENADEAMKAAKFFEKIFGFTVKEGNSSVFASTYIEAMKSPYLGKNGHIAIRTNSLERAMYYLGDIFDESTLKTNAKGQKTAIYLKEEIAGFAVHIVQA